MLYQYLNLSSYLTDSIALGVLEKHKEFYEALVADEELQAHIQGESLEFVNIIEDIPFIADLTRKDDVRYESLIRKLVTHVRENLTIVNNEKVLNIRCTRSSIWTMKAFRKMIENKWNMNIFERDENGGEEEDLASQEVVDAFDACGVTALCLDLIASGIDEELQVESIRLMVAMLLREGCFYILNIDKCLIRYLFTILF